MTEIQKVKRQRNRVSVVCLPCKAKKIKCDRKKPCLNCLKAATPEKCCYEVDTKKQLNQLELKRKRKKTAKSPEHTDTSTEPADDGSSDSKVAGSILHHEFLMNDYFVVFRKPSRTQLIPGIFSYHLRHKSFVFHDIMHSFKQSLNAERRLWKSTNFQSPIRTLDLSLNVPTFTEEEERLNRTVEEKICKNYYAVLERLNYFQTQLNGVLFDYYIPMGVVQLIFHHYFVMRPEGIVFIHPKKKFEYSFIALISSIVELTNVFTKRDKCLFNFSSSFKGNEFNELTIRLLNTSNFRRKPSIFIVYVLLNLRLSLMIYGDAQSGGMIGQNSYPFFQNAVNICLELGIHVNQDKVKNIDKIYASNTNPGYNDLLFFKEITNESIKRLWNHLLVLDSIYSLSLSCAPLIDERYSHGIYLLNLTSCQLYDDFVKFAREVSFLTVQDRPVSFEKMLQLNKSTVQLISRAGYFENFKVVEVHEEKWCILQLKFVLLKFYFMLQICLRVLLSDDNLKNTFSSEILQKEKNKNLIKKLQDETLMRAKLLFFIGLNSVHQMSQAKLGNKFLLYNRGTFSTWLGFESVIFIEIIMMENLECSSNKGNHKINSNHIENEKAFSEFSLQRLENMLYNFDTSTDLDSLETFNNLITPKFLASYLTKVYESVVDLPILLYDYNFFVMSKILLIVLYFIYCSIKADCVNNFNSEENVQKLKNMTERIFKNRNVGELTHIVMNDQLLNEIHSGNKDQNPVMVTNNNSVTECGKKPNNTEKSFHLNEDNERLSNYQALTDPTFNPFDEDYLSNILDELNDYFNSTF